MQGVHEGVERKCDVCSQGLRDFRNLKDHKQVVHEGVERKCEDCRKTYGTIKCLKNHTKLGCLGCEKSCVRFITRVSMMLEI